MNEKWIKNEWKWIKMNENEWKWMTMNDNEWQWMKMNENEWKWIRTHFAIILKTPLRDKIKNSTYHKRPQSLDFNRVSRNIARLWR